MSDELNIEVSDAAEAPILRKPAEEWAKAKGTPDWLFAATRAHFQWAIGRELTEADYDKAVSATANIPIGYHLEHKK